MSRLMLNSYLMIICTKKNQKVKKIEFSIFSGFFTQPNILKKFVWKNNFYEYRPVKFF